MKSFLLGFITAFVLIGAVAAAIIYSGNAPLSAANAQTPLLDWLFHTSYEQALQRHAQRIQLPEQMNTEPQLFSGAISFAEMCSGCHIPPGAEETPYSQGLKPSPPKLVDIMRERTPEEAFWVLDNGIHFTGMPAIGKTHDDQTLWAMVEFLNRAKTMQAADYQRVLELARAAQGESGQDDGHDHSH